MNYGDQNFIEITQQTKLGVALVVSSQSNQSSSSCRASRAVLFHNVDTAKMHGMYRDVRITERGAKKLFCSSDLRQKTKLASD